MELADLDIQKKLTGGLKRNRLHRETRNWAWLRAVTHHLNGTEFYLEEFRDNHRLRYGLMPKDIPTTTGTGRSNCRDEDRHKRPRFLEARDHRNV